MKDWALSPLPWSVGLGKNNYGLPLWVARSARIQFFRLASRAGHVAIPRGDSDVMTRALAAAGADRVLLEEFWTLDEDENGVSSLRGRDFGALGLPRLLVCAYRFEFRSAVRLGGTAGGKAAQDPLITPADTPPGVRLSSPREAVPL